MKLEALDNLVVFVAVAEAKSFRVAGERLGVSASAVSQALRKLEDRIGVSLVHRTTRSVSLSAAGEQLLSVVRPLIADVDSAVASLTEFANTPRGSVRLLVGTATDSLLGGPVLIDFLKAHPQVNLEIDVSDSPVDIVAEGYDAGIQIGEVINRDMIALPITGDLRMTVVGGPAYFTRHPKPEQPRDLVDHDCLNWHEGPGAPAYRWEFTEQQREISVAVRSRVLSTDSEFRIRLCKAGLGLGIFYLDQVRDDVASGELVPVLEKFCAPFPGYYLFYPHRRQASPALMALVEHLVKARRQRVTR